MPHRQIAALLAHLTDEIQTSVGEASTRIATRAHELHRKFGEAELKAARKMPTPEEVKVVLERVRNALASGERIVGRDARTAVFSFRKFAPEEIGRVLESQPSAWKRFVSELFAAKLLLTTEEWAAWSRIAAKAPPSVTLLHGDLDKKHLLISEPHQSAIAVARDFKSAQSLAVLDAQICAPGLLHRGWPFTSLVFAHWVLLRPERWNAVWGELESEVLFEAMLLPRRENKSLFRPEIRFPAGIPSNVFAQAAFAAACLGPHLSGKKVDEDRADLLIRFLIEAWGDPRSEFRVSGRPSLQGWKQLAEVDEGTYDALIERLLSADLDLFFENIPFEGGRRKYWRGYLKKMVATTFFFSARTKEHLRRKFGRDEKMHEKVDGALRRARDLVGAGGLDALALVFKRGVVIEFSQKGNAAYFYTHEQYRTLLMQQQRSHGLTASRLKSTAVGGRQMIHYDHGWTDDFDRELSRYL